MGNSEVIVTCENPACSRKITKRLAEFKRSEKLGRQHFCSLKCYGQFKGIFNFKDRINRDTSHLREIIRKDDFSAFRYHLKVMKKSAKEKNQDCSVTLASLKLLWEKQKGICPYTGWNLVLLPCTTDYESTLLTTDRASVDRKDSSGGYTFDNIQFVAVIANYAKNAFTEQDLIEFCNDVSMYRHLDCKTYYSLECFKRDNADNTLRATAEDTKQLYPVNRRDEYSPFRQHLISARKRVSSKGRECNITLQELKKLWETQGGRCPYTGWELDNPETTNYLDSYQLHPRRASLDRIDSSLGYVPGNIQFVSVIANYAKRDFKEEKLLEFCRAVAGYRLGKSSNAWLGSTDNL
jgi:YHS domain-containing protein